MLYLVEQLDMCETKNQFKFELNKILIEENKKTDTMEELVKKIVSAMKEWVIIEKPRMNLLDGAWRIYAQKQYNKNMASGL